MDSLISVVITLTILGLAVWLIETYVPMSAPIRAVLRVVLVLALVVWLLRVFGLWSGRLPF